jgi:penicillin-binding protein 1C
MQKFKVQCDLIGKYRRSFLCAGLLLTATLILLSSLRFFSSPLLANVSFSHQVLDADGNLLRLTLSGDEKYRIFVPFAEIDPNFVQAVLLHEDRHFYLHPGFNPIALFKAAGRTYLSGGRRMGGSTITMQLARMTSTFSSKTINGKLKQLGLALWIEASHSKLEILEAYLNLLPYGANIEGIQAASLIYFHKSAKQLTLAESLTLAVIPQNPPHRSMRAESGGNDRLKAARRRLFLAWQLEKKKALSGGDRLSEGAEPQVISSAELELALPVVSQQVSQLPFAAPHFVDFVLHKHLSQTLIKTTLSQKLQEMAEKKVRSYVNSHAESGVNNASVMILNHETMEVVAMVGSKDFRDLTIEGQVNGTMAKRSPGSTLKPFIYGLALDQGLIHPLSLMKDTPMRFGGFDPENFDRHFTGPLSATDALVRSRNVPAVYLNSLLRQPSFYEFLKSAHVTALREPSFYGLALALGGAELTMEEIVELYAMLANRGVWQPLQYERSVAREGSAKKFKVSTPARLVSHAPLLSPEAAFLVLNMLRQNPRVEQNFSDNWTRDTVPVAWKTGTSQGFRDAWSVGVVGPYVIAVWLGNFDNQSNQAFIGRDLAAPLFFNLVDALKNQATGREAWLNPWGLNLKKVKVCALSGHLPGKHCEHLTESWFIPGKSPISTCPVHRQILVSQASGLRACDETKTGLRKETFEFWPSDLAHVYAAAGVARQPPPSYEPSCTGVERQAGGGLPPAITSPSTSVVYTIRRNQKDLPSGQLEIPLQAVADGDAHKLFWFIGNELIGSAEPQKPVLWNPRPGKFMVRVVDDLGRNDSRFLEVRSEQ